MFTHDQLITHNYNLTIIHISGINSFASTGNKSQLTFSINTSNAVKYLEVNILF